MCTASEHVMATVRDLTALAKTITDPISKAQLEGLVEDWTVEALILDAWEKEQDRTE